MPRFIGAVRRIPPEAIAKLLPASPELLIRLANQRYRGAEHAEVRRILTERTADLIERGDYPEAQRHYYRSSVLALSGSGPQAVESLYRAVELRGRDADWRYQLALALRNQGMLEEAHEQAALCARMDPHKRLYRTLLEEINHTRLRQRTDRE